MLATPRIGLLSGPVSSRNVLNIVSAAKAIVVASTWLVETRKALIQVAEILLADVIDIPGDIWCAPSRILHGAGKRAIFKIADYAEGAGIE
jgi:hypothetical protein